MENKTLKIDGIEYIRKDIIKSKVKLTEFQLETSDNYKVIAFGSARLKDGNWIMTKISTRLLQRAIDALKAIDCNEVAIIWTKDNPLILGSIKGNNASGIFIAPRVGND